LLAAGDGLFVAKALDRLVGMGALVPVELRPGFAPVVVLGEGAPVPCKASGVDIGDVAALTWVAVRSEASQIETATVTATNATAPKPSISLRAGL
jgi:hypothetical protein